MNLNLAAIKEELFEFDAAYVDERNVGRQNGKMSRIEDDIEDIEDLELYGDWTPGTLDHVEPSMMNLLAETFPPESLCDVDGNMCVPSMDSYLDLRDKRAGVFRDKSSLGLSFLGTDGNRSSSAVGTLYERNSFISTLCQFVGALNKGHRKL